MIRRENPSTRVIATSSPLEGELQGMAFLMTNLFLNKKKSDKIWAKKVFILKKIQHAYFQSFLIIYN